MSRLVEAVAAMTLAAIVIAAAVAIGYAWWGCHERGGAFVRGVFWFECVAQR